MTHRASMIRCAAAALIASGVLHAQATKDYDFHLDNGAEVVFQTYSQVDLNDPARNFGSATASGNVINRNMTDGKNQTWLGFQLHIDRLAGDPIRFRISMGRVGFDWGFFGQTAPPREIQNGDRVLLDVLQEPGTGRKVYDTFQVGIGVGLKAMPVAKTIPQIAGSGTVIHLRSPELVTDKTFWGKNRSSLNGSQVSVLVPGKGRFSFSTQSGPGFRMEAIAEGNVLMFVTGSDRFDIQCASPIVDGPGAWYLWVRRDAVDAAKGTTWSDPSVPSLDLKQ